MATPAFNPVSYAASQTATAAPSFDPVAYAQTANQPAAPPSGPSGVPMPGSIFGPEHDFLTGFGLETAAPIAGAIGAGFRGLWDIASGQGLAKASQDVQSTEQNVNDLVGLNKPLSESEQAGIDAAKSNWNPLNWPGLIASKAGSGLAALGEKVGAPPSVETALKIAPTAALSFLPVAKGAFRATAEGETAAAGASEGGAGAESETNAGKATPKTATESETAEDATPEERKAILERVGLQNMRQSALDGNKLDAAAQYQMTRYNQPAGLAAAEQFDHEMSALSNHAAGIVEGTGGTLGMDEEALANKGDIIDKPFSLARDWFDNQTRSLYTEADARAQGVPVGLSNFQKVLNDDSLMTNQDRIALRNGANSYAKQLNMVADGPNGPIIQGTAANAETMRKYLNAEWSPQNSRFVGQLKSALDEDVTKAAGEDIYARARAIRALRGRTLDDPKGISQIFETDPNTPINRATPLEKIPSRLTSLPVDQFSNVLSVLKNMPEEIQPAAQAALGEIRGYMANKLLKAGTENRVGGGRAVWNGDAVTNILKTNSAKYNLAFQDDPVSFAKIKDLNKAGQILKVPTSYPGADAQAANAMKSGLWSRVTPGIMRLGGAAAGGVFGPVGAGAGEAAGGAAGKILGLKAAEKAALNAWKKQIVTAGPG